MKMFNPFAGGILEIPVTLNSAAEIMRYNLLPGARVDMATHKAMWENIVK